MTTSCFFTAHFRFTNSLLKIAVVLGASEPFSDLFKTTEITSIQQIIDGEFD